MFRLLSSPNEVVPFLPLIIEASNEERNAFGFLPKGTYSDFAYQGQMIVAVDEVTNEFTGYAIFAGALPTAKLRQSYVRPAWRRKGLGKLLVAAVITRCEQIGYLSIKATVASDLLEANAFYEAQGFAKFAEKPGGPSRNRTLIVRARELDTPSLLNLPVAALSASPGIILNALKIGPVPIYLFDLNVLFDVTQQRARREEAGRVFAAAFENSVKLAISSEFVDELERHTSKHSDDPILQLARALPIVPKPTTMLAAEHFVEIAELIFPGRHSSNKLTERDRSDIAHLTTAIVENVAGFVTSEKAILRLAPAFREKYSIEVVSPSIFASAPDDQLPPRTEISVEDNDRTITSRNMTEADREALTVLANRLGIAPAALRVALSQGTSRSSRTRVVVRDGTILLAAATWQVNARDEASSQLYIFVDTQDEAAELAVDHLLDVACRSISISDGGFVWIDADQMVPLVRDRALNFGFQQSKQGVGGSEKLKKVCWGKPITPENWFVVANSLAGRFGLNLQQTAPTFEDSDKVVESTNADGTRTRLKLQTLEDFLGPTLLALEARPAIIVPIWPSYAEALFQGSLQPGFFAGQRAGLLPQKCYLSDASTVNLVPDHGLMVFYESVGKGGPGGRSAAIAIARIQRRYLANEDAAIGLTQLRGVLSQSDIRSMAKDKNVCVTEFDSLMKFRNPVPLRKLKEIGCADGANLVTTKRLEMPALQKLIEIGEPRAATYD